MTTVLVTGGAGYIGSHVCKALAEAGDKPVCYDTLEKGHDWAVQWGPLERGDIGDAARLDEVFARHRPQAVIHLAGYIEVGESVRQPERYLHNNATKTDALIEAALRHGIEAFVFSSSCAVYGLPQTDLLAETHPIAPISPYAESKAQRRARARRGRRSRPALGVVALLQRRRRRPRRRRSARRTIRRPICCRWPPMPRSASARPLTLLGTDYPTPDGSCIRDFVHVSDLADAHLRALDWLRAGRTAAGHEAFNLGSGVGLQRAPGAGRDRPHRRQARAARGRAAPSRRFAQAGR